MIIFPDQIWKEAMAYIRAVIIGIMLRTTNLMA